MTEELKPCPFCGSHHLEPQMRTGWIKCENCGANARPDAWNTRAPVKVKPLKWEPVNDCVWDADGMGKLYRVLKRRNGVTLRDTQWGDGQQYDSLNAAKAAAQADYERRIREALT